VGRRTVAAAYRSPLVIHSAALDIPDFGGMVLERTGPRGGPSMRTVALGEKEGSVRRFTIAMGAVVALTVASISPALATHSKDHLYGCSDGFRHVEALFKTDKDNNGNGYVCQKVVLLPGKKGFLITTDDHPIPLLIIKK
jgi:hypothetical protein